LKQFSVGLAKWVKPGKRFARNGMAAVQVIQVREGFAFEFCWRQVFQEALIGLQTDLGIAI